MPSEHTPFSVNWLVHRIHGRFVAEAMAEHSTGLLLDVGCGARPFTQLLDGQCRRSLGIEVDRVRYAGSVVHSGEVAVGGQILPTPDVWASGMSLPFLDNRFDTVVSFQVLEHVPEPGLMMMEMARVLRPGGALVVTAPHIWGVHEEPHDYYRFTPHGLQYLAEGSGLMVERVEAMAGYYVTAAARFCYWLQGFEKLGLHALTRPLMAIVQLKALVLDRLHRVDGDAWNHILVARKPVAQ
ncbi:MAG: methyltransferase domain-containing protein [Candidatus Latescibacterota bacterium]|nr:methyltransferase domain-containing protein [Candidatus Latescibacterota bacterium]